MHQWMERQRKKWEVTLRGKAKKESEGRVTGVKGQKTKRRREGSKMEEGEWGGETGRRLGGAPLGKRGGREYKKGGVKSDLAQQYNWGSPTRND